MKRMLLLICVLLVFSAAPALGGCSKEETGVVDFVKWYVNQKSGLPLYSGDLEAAVSAPVEIYFDDYGVAHIFAENEPDLMFTQGYVHAIDRIFQIDLYEIKFHDDVAEHGI